MVPVFSFLLPVGLLFCFLLKTFFHSHSNIFLHLFQFAPLPQRGGLLASFYPFLLSHLFADLMFLLLHGVPSMPMNIFAYQPLAVPVSDPGSDLITAFVFDVVLMSFFLQGNFPFYDFHWTKVSEMQSTK